MPRRGTFVVFDGIDGSGKGTLVRALAAHIQSKRRGRRVFDVQAYCERHHRLPQPEELKPFAIIVSAEPTFAFIGLAIREEIIRRNIREYSARITAQAFALDRFVLYRRIIIPALKQGKFVIQDRSVTTSICYQPIQRERLPLSALLKLEGNALALAVRPDLLMLMKIKPETAIQRLKRRSGKRDHATFERLSFLTKAQRRFESRWFRSFMARRGSTVAYIDTNTSLRASTDDTIAVWETYQQHRREGVH